MEASRVLVVVCTLPYKVVYTKKEESVLSFTDLTIGLVDASLSTESLTGRSSPHYDLLLKDDNYSLNDANMEWSIEFGTSGNIGLFNALQGSGFHHYYTIGALPDLKDFEENVIEEIKDELLIKYQTIPVFPGTVDPKGNFYQFCKHTLWPLFHYLGLDYTVGRSQSDEHWRGYVACNQAFRDAVVSAYKHGDMIWIHDYHLLLLPEMLREKMPDVRIGFFLHVPFPSSEIFRMLNVRQELLRGMLGANYIAFQSYSYLRSFLQTVTRILGYDYVPGQGIVLPDGSSVQIGVNPISINAYALRVQLTAEDTLSIYDVLQGRYRDMKIIFGRDKLDPVKGILQKIHAFEKLLELYPQYVGKLVFVQVALSTVDHITLFRQVSERVSRINSVYGSIGYQPILFLYQDISFPHYLAMLRLCDVFVVSSLRDGMNLTSFEHVACQDKDDPGVLLLSEFAGAFQNLGSAIKINPWDTTGMAHKIQQALEMPLVERQRRQSLLEQYLEKHTAVDWVLYNLVGISCSATKSRRISHVNDESALIAALRRSDFVIIVHYSVLDFYKRQHVPLDKVVGLFRGIKTVLFFQESLEDIDSSPFRDLPICFEGGSYLKVGSEVISLLSDDDFSWKDKVKTILDYYTERTEVEQNSVMYWDLSMVESCLASRQINECQSHITETFIPFYPVDIIYHPTSLEIRPIGSVLSSLINYTTKHFHTSACLLLHYGGCTDIPSSSINPSPGSHPLFYAYDLKDLEFPTISLHSLIARSL